MAPVAMKFLKYIAKEIERFVVKRRFVFSQSSIFCRGNRYSQLATWEYFLAFS
jgi:hypothetical protein